MPKVQTLSALAKAGALSGKRVFIRADLNVPFDDAGRISEDTRIRASVPGIRLALDAGAAVMVTSHLGRPKEGVLTEADSLAKVGQRLSELLGMPVPLVQNWVDGVKVDAGQVVLLENCRVNVGEKGRRGAGQEDGRVVRRLRQRRLRHGAPRRGHHARHRSFRAGGLRRSAAGSRAGRAGPRLA